MERPNPGNVRRPVAPLTIVSGPKINIQFRHGRIYSGHPRLFAISSFKQDVI
jgi:hypothetical protein